MIPGLRTKALVIVAVVAVGVLDARVLAQQSCRLREVYSSSSFYSLKSVAAISPDDVWVTGESESTYFLHWDGSEWQLIRGPEPDNGHFKLAAVAGVRPDEVWAVGQKTSGNDAVVLRWDGTAWRVVYVPRVGRQSTLEDVAVLDDGTAFAVGAYRPDTGRGIRPLIYRYNGTEWRRESVKSDDRRFGLTDVDGTSMGSKAVWAVAASRRFALRRREAGWTKVYLPERDVTLEDVAVAPLGSTWFAIASRRPAVYRRTTLGWERFEMPDERYPEHLRAIDARTGGNVWVAGYRLFDARAYPYAARMMPTQTFEYVRADDPGWITLWDIALDPAEGVWAVGQTSEGGIVQRGC